MAKASSHHLKYRRCIGTSQLDSTLRYTSIFIILIAFLEFSGVSDFAADTYSLATSPTPRSIKSTADAFPITNTPRPGFSPAVTRLQKESDHQRRLRRNREKLNFLYKNVDPQTTLAKHIKSSKREPPASDKPTFMLEMHWNEENFEDKVCRIHNACLKKDGSVLVHAWMKSQQHHLRECGVRKVVYMESEKEFDEGDKADKAMDLFGVQPTRYHIPHFLTDILPMIYASEVLRPTSSSMKAKSVCEAPKKRRCSKHVNKEKLFPGFFAEDRLGELAVSSWVPQLAAMLPGRPTARFSSEIFNNTDKACFRSIISYEIGSHVRSGPEWYGEAKMFENHGITRASVLRNTTGRCRVHITILNRFGWETRAGYLVGRDVTNIDDLTDAIQKLSKKEAYKNVDAKVAVEYFENKSFAEQVDIMQKADVILGVHGAGLGNLVFARQDTPFLEILPFTYYAGPFDSIAAALYLQYSRIVAEPDTKNFFECIEARARRENDESIARKAKSLWNEAVKRRKESGDLNYLTCHKFRSKSLSSMKICSRSQRLKVDIRETAKRLLNMAQHVCGRKTED